MKNKFIKIAVFALATCGLLGISLPVFAEDCSNICSPNCTSVPPTVKDSYGCTSNTSDKLPGTIQKIVNAVILVLGTVAVVFIVIGGVQYMTSAGDPSKTKKAKDTILYATIGLIICALSFAIVNFVIVKLLDGPSNYTSSSDCANAGYTWNSTSGTCE